jgi:hypothetical protein
MSLVTKDRSCRTKQRCERGRRLSSVRGGLVAGDWAYLYRAVDSTGKTIEFMLSPTRDLIAAKLFYALLYSVAGPHRGSSMSMDIQPTPARSPS